MRQRVTLEDIALRKEQVKEELKTQKQLMAADVRRLVAPLAPATHKANALVRTFNMGFALFDGIMVGARFMNRIRRYFRK